jgi:hypothetical protein
MSIIASPSITQKPPVSTLSENTSRSFTKLTRRSPAKLPPYGIIKLDVQFTRIQYEQTMDIPNNNRTSVIIIIICVLLVASVVAIYHQTTDFGFVGFDDDDYITKNPNVQSGITYKSLAWAFSSTYASNWHPLTWISHMLDVELFGLDPSGHHLTNLILHAVNSILLLFVLIAATQRLWASAFVAALFAVHPLHVESVAWISERKDVLSTFFWMLAVLAYIRYARKPTIGRYMLVVLIFTLGLMAKPMLITLPFVLLMLDWWPLGRNRKQGYLSYLYEKLPLFTLSAASCVITYVAQQRGGSVATLEVFPLGVRVANAVTAYVAYIGKMFLPSGLAAFYPHPGSSLPVWQTIGAALLLIAITGVVVRLARSYPYLIVGWLWYIVTLIPVIGLVQVGNQAMADRYTYIPLIGLFIIIAWGVTDLTRLSEKNRAAILTISAICVLVVLIIAAHMQTRYWRDDMTLWKRAIAVTSNNATAYFNLGCDYYFQGDIHEAIRYYREAIKANPRFAWPHYNLAIALEDLGRPKEALYHYYRAVSIAPRFAQAHSNLGLLLANMGRFREAERHYLMAIKADPNYEIARHNLARLREFLGEGR